MSEFDIDKYIERKREEEKAFANVKDPRTGDYVSFPSIEVSEEDTIKVKNEIKKKPKKKDIKKEEEKPKLRFKYSNDGIGRQTICEFEMKLDYGMHWEIPWRIKDWVDERVDIKGSGNAFLNRINYDENLPILNLVITGSDKDNRCRVCKSFWTSMLTESEDSSFEIQERKKCYFED